jgi:hypothetical protein
MTETAARTPAMRSDYAINAGSQTVNQIYRGPASLAEGDGSSYVWPDVSSHNGICYQRSLVQAASVSDGMSKTLLLGEKYVNPSHYTDGWDFSENSNPYTGYENDNHRVTANPPQQDRHVRRLDAIRLLHCRSQCVGLSRGAKRRSPFAI